MASEDCRGVALSKPDPCDSRYQRRKLRLGKPVKQMNFTYVYILQSEVDPERFYTGSTYDLRARLKSHNAGRVPHTSKWKPWSIKTYIAISDAQRSIRTRTLFEVAFRSSIREETSVARRSREHCRAVVPRLRELETPCSWQSERKGSRDGQF